MAKRTLTEEERNEQMIRTIFGSPAPRRLTQDERMEVVSDFRHEVITLAEAADELDPDDMSDTEGEWVAEVAPQLYGALTYKRHLTQDRGIKLA